jgi:hypothetical protein
MSTDVMPEERGVSRAALIGLPATLLIAAIGLTWAKWWPCFERVGTILDTDA